MRIYTIFILLLIGFSSQAQFMFGGGLKYNTNNQFSALAPNAKVVLGIGDNFDINVDAAYYLSKQAGWSFDADLHYRLLTIADKIRIEPFAGLDFTKTTKFTNSLLFGAALKYLGDHNHIYLEPKWILNDKQLVISAGVLF